MAKLLNSRTFYLITFLICAQTCLGKFSPFIIIKKMYFPLSIIKNKVNEFVWSVKQYNTITEWKSVE